MKIGINSLHQIKQVREITDENLTIIELDESNEFYPFKGWSDIRILCYCYNVSEGGVSVYPYIDTNIIERLEGAESQSEMLMLALDELDMQRETDKTESELAIAELAETVLGGV